jgi:hypothetical protein
VADSGIVSEAKAYVQEIDEMGELPLVVRRRLIDRLASRLDDAHDANFRAILGLTCARKSWPIWKAAFGMDSWPMDLAEAALSGIGDRSEAQAISSRELMEVKSYLDEKFLLGEEFFPAVYAGFASWAVARDVLAGNHPSPPTGDSELQIPPEEWEPCFLASLALIGGATWEGIGSPERRHEFWEWYLLSAVPNSFKAASSE